MSEDTPVSARSLPGVHVLLVEDDATLSEAMERMLGAAGCKVSTAADFRRALDVLEGPEPIDLMLTDIVMPRGINGVALGRMARMRRRDIRLIYMTAYDIPGIDTEADGPVLRKPITAERLIAEMERALGRA